MSTLPNPPLDATENLVGQLIDGRYQILAVLGSGGMGTVYHARHIGLERDVAVKVLRPQLASQQTWIKRFMQEARAASKIRHINVVETSDFGMLPGGAAYCVMEMLEGHDLSSLIKQLKRVPWPRARSILVQMVRGLGAAHECGVIHRDVKPANCFLLDAHAAGRLFDTLGGPDLVKMLDFGIAKVVGDDRGDLTATNELIGTATYMAPERAARGVADVRADIYSVGIVAYKLLTGVVPFRGETMFATLSQHVHATPASIRVYEANVPEIVEQVVFKALAKHPDHRYQTMAEFEQALLSVDEGGNWVGSTGPMFPLPPVPAAPARQMVTGRLGSIDLDSATEVDTRVSSLTESHTFDEKIRKRSLLPIAAGFAALAVAAAGTAVFLLAREGRLGNRVESAVAGAESKPVVDGEGEPPVIANADSAAASTPERGEPDPADDAPTQGNSAPDHPEDDPVDPPEDPDSVVSGDAPRDAEESSPPHKRATRRPSKHTKPKRDPEPASDASVLEGLAKKARARCNEHGDGAVVVKFSVLSSGRASLPRANPPHEHSAAGNCVVALVRSATFPEGRMRAAQLEVKL